MNRDAHEMLARLERAGFSTDDAMALRRISMTLHRWHELECGDGNDYASWGIERDETTGKPYMLTHPHTGKSRRSAIADRERGALKRLDAIMARYPEFAAYVQGDPRGAALYVYRKDSLMLTGSKYGIDSCYSSVGIAVYK
jgi:hypothetical protein